MSSLSVSNSCGSEAMQTNMIWEGNPYASFTSLVYFNNHLYCAFREGKTHYDPSGKDNGRIRIIKLKEDNVWDTVDIVSEDGYDLRDPKLSIMPDGRLMLLTERVQISDGKVVARNTCVGFLSYESDEVGNLMPIEISNLGDWNWLWDVTWIDGVGYGFIYVPYFAFVKTIDGIHYTVEERSSVEYNPTEASIAKFDEGLICVARCDSSSIVGQRKYFDEKWQWTVMDNKIECPKILSIGKYALISGRTFIDGKPSTALYKLNVATNRTDEITIIPSGKDCGYPGMVVNDDIVYISSYYGDGNKSSIYLSTLKVK